MEAKEVTKWQDETALNRFRLISPLIDPALDPAKRAKLRREIADNNEISERSLFRYEKAYREGSFAGLKPASRAAEPREGPFPGFKDVLDEAILLPIYPARELPIPGVTSEMLGGKVVQKDELVDVLKERIAQSPTRRGTYYRRRGYRSPCARNSKENITRIDKSADYMEEYRDRYHGIDADRRYGGRV